MGKYLKDRVRLAISVLNEVESYLVGKLIAENESDTVLKVEYDSKNKSYILPDGLSEDEFFNYIENQNRDHNNACDSLDKKEEEIDLPKLKEGTLRKRSDGRWEARYYYDNQRKSVFAKTQKECIRKLKQAIKERDTEIRYRIVNKNMSLNQWFDQWIKIYKEPHINNVDPMSRTY